MQSCVTSDIPRIPSLYGCLNACSCRQAGFPEPIYHQPHSGNRTNTLAKHAPKGAWRNPQKR
jgi:hypothetical protein